jgi:hypothetical protein
MKATRRVDMSTAAIYLTHYPAAPPPDPALDLYRVAVARYQHRLVVRPHRCSPKKAHSSATQPLFATGIRANALRICTIRPDTIKACSVSILEDFQDQVKLIRIAIP